MRQTHEAQHMSTEERYNLFRWVLEVVWENVPAYRRKMERVRIVPDDIRSLDDIRKLPFTTKNDLRDNYPTGLLARPVKELVRFHASSGTTGKPTVVAYTARDIENWTELMARGLALAGVTRDDVVHVAYGYGLFTGGLGLHNGAERLGATVVPASGGFTDRQIMLMEDLGATVLCCTPSYALHLAEALRKEGKSLPALRLGIFGAEPWSEELRRRIEMELGITALDVYGLSEIMGPGVGMECPHKNGLHLWDDHFLAEIIDPESGDVLPEGTRGELVMTTLTKEALPLIRYRTRDLTTLHTDVCSCGLAGSRIGRIGARSDDMLIIRGVNVFPSQVEVALGQLAGLSLHYVLEVSERDGMKDLTVICEAEKDMPEPMRQHLERDAGKHLHDVLGIRVGIRVEVPGSIPRSQGKAVRLRKAA